MRRRLLTAALAALLATACEQTPTTSPQAPTAGPSLAVVFNEPHLPFAFVQGTCEEDVAISGRAHILVAETFSAHEDTTTMFHVDAKGTGEGLTTGATYQWMDAFNFFAHQVDHSVAVVDTAETMTLVGRGGAADLHLRWRFHLTTNATGDLTVLIDGFAGSCG